MKLHYRTVRPPAAIRKARLDNITIVPASVLSQRGHYTAIKKRVPNGGVLILTPSLSGILHTRSLQAVVANVASYFRDRGRAVTTIPMEMLMNRQAMI